MHQATSKIRARHLFRSSRAEIDTAAKPSDGLVVFSVMWGLATTLSVVSHFRDLNVRNGWLAAGVQWTILAACLLLIMRPRQTWRLGLVAVLITGQYLGRLPVPSNNQTIAFFMNSAILVVLGLEVLKTRTLAISREVAFERLRVVARALLAVMYFYGIFHKINSDFLDPAVSCAAALYTPLARPFGLGASVAGIYAAIISTFVVEAICIVSLYWRRFFWVGLILGLSFHYVIPISGYSWYMDFSSLVLALYMLSVPREVAAGMYSTAVSLLRRVPFVSAGPTAIGALLVLLAVCGLAVTGLADALTDSPSSLLWHSSWMLVWAVVGGSAIVLVTRAALLELPYRSPRAPRQPLWLYLFPGVLFVTCLSPYVGLKTESSIAMFSNLHTEGGTSNHLLFPTPPYLFDYQRRVVRVIATSNPGMRRLVGEQTGIVEFGLGQWLSKHPRDWVTYEVAGERFDRITAATFPGQRGNLVENALLLFKPVNFARPKACTH